MEIGAAGEDLGVALAFFTKVFIVPSLSPMSKMEGESEREVLVERDLVVEGGGSEVAPPTHSWRLDEGYKGN